MLLREYVTLLQQAVGGGVDTDDAKIADLSLEAEFPRWRQEAMFIIWNGTRPTRAFPSGRAANKFLSAANYTNDTLTFDANIQDEGADYRIFQGEPPLMLDQYTSGCIFCGDKLTGQTFVILKNPGEYYVDKMAGNIDPDKVYVEITGNTYKVWGNTQVESIDLIYLASDPLNISDFDPETDDYPIGPDVWAVLEKLAIDDLMPEALRPADTFNDAAQSQERAPRGR